MTTYNLSFCEITLLQADIAEVIVNEGVEIDLTMQKEYSDFFSKKMKRSFSLLVNRVNSYSHKFEVQQSLNTVPNVNSTAVIIYSASSETAIKYLSSIPRERPLNVTTFTERQTALTWLQKNQATSSDACDFVNIKSDQKAPIKS